MARLLVCVDPGCELALTYRFVADSAVPAPARVPVVNYLVLADEPYLRGYQCARCGATFLDRRTACPGCGQDEFCERRLAGTGAVRAYTVVHRGPPGVHTPFAAAVIDLDEGGTVK